MGVSSRSVPSDLWLRLLCSSGQRRCKPFSGGLAAPPDSVVGNGGRATSGEANGAGADANLSRDHRADVVSKRSGRVALTVVGEAAPGSRAARNARLRLP